MENQNMENPETALETQQEKTFTQEQVNAIVGKRLAEAKASNEALLSKRENELNQREMQLKAKELLSERGLPKELAEVMRYADEESLTKAIDIIDKTRGFKQEKKKDSHIIIEPNRLPTYWGIDEPNPIRKAMGLE